MPIPLVTRILVADDHALVRTGLKHVIDAEPDLEVVAEAADGAEAIKRALAEDIHLAILDISMPRLTGLYAARRALAPTARAAPARCSPCTTTSRSCSKP